MAKPAETPTGVSGARDPEQDRFFIEDLAMLLEFHSRYPRTAGRIYALMLISDRPHHSQQELAEALGVSQPSVSTMTRRLVDDGLLERFHTPGSRADQYRLRREGWANVLRQYVHVVHRFIEQFDHGLALPGPDIGPARRHLLDIRDVYERLAKALEDAAQDLETKH